MSSEKDLIIFKKGNLYNREYIYKILGECFFECEEKGYFKKTEDGKYIFTEVGFNAAWKGSKE